MSENMSVVEYKVAQTAKVMDMFSNRLYQDKINSVLRELSTNAWDSHIQANTTDLVPKVHLPSYNDNLFSIRDYGTGMSQQELEEVYTTYGASNKEDTNVLNGCMGIGSKSPFAYVDEFYTTSYYEGTKYVYLNYKEPSGKPILSFISSEPTDEHNGLEISFQCSDDYYQFSNRFSKLMTWFPKPFEVNLYDFEVDRPHYRFNGSFWHATTDYKRSYAVMGWVKYPIDHRHFDKPTQDVLLSSVLIHFDNGALDMDISREGLQYTQKTIDAIHNAVVKIIEETRQHIDKLVKESDGWWEAKQKFYSLKTGKINFLSSFELEGDGWNTTSLKKAVSIDPTACYTIKSLQSSRNQSVSCRPINKLAPVSNTEFLLADMKTGNIAAARRHYKSSNATFIYLVEPKTPNKDECFESFRRDFGVTVTTNCSGVPKAPRKPRSTTKTYSLMLDWSYNKLKAKQYWKDADVNFEEGGVYVPIAHWMPQTINYELNALCENLRWLVDQVGAVPEIIGVKTQYVKKYDDASNWIKLDNWLVNTIRKLAENPEKYGGLQDLEMFHSLFSSARLVCKLSKESDMFCDDIKYFAQDFREFEELIMSKEDNITTMSNLCVKLDLPYSSLFDPRPSYQHIKTNLDKINKYQILTVLAPSYNRTNIENIVQIMNLVYDHEAD